MSKASAFIEKNGIVFILAFSIVSLFVILGNFLNKYSSIYSYTKCVDKTNENSDCLIGFIMSIISMVFLFICICIIFTYLLWTPNGEYANDFFNRYFKGVVITLILIAFITQLLASVFGNITSGQEKTIETIEKTVDLSLYSLGTVLTFLNLLIVIIMFAIFMKNK
jgi:hypothetical protein